MVRRRLLWVALAVVSIGTWGYLRYYVARPTGSGPAGPAVAREPFQETWTNRAVHVLGVGDSITAGLGADQTSHSYFNRLLSNPSDEFPDMRGLSLSVVLPNLTSKNYAISGSESRTHLEVIENQIPVHDERFFGIIAMTTGGNDLIHMYGRSPPRECAMYGASYEQAAPWIENFAGRLRSMIEKLNSKFPGGCEIYLADIYDPTDGVGDGASIMLGAWPDGLKIHAAYNEKIREVTRKHDNVHLVPIYEAFLGHGAHCRQFWRATYQPDDPHYWFYSNVEDPNDRGYDALRRVFLNEIVANCSLRTRSATPSTLPGANSTKP